MSRSAMVLSLIALAGCSRTVETEAVVGGTGAEVVDGGTVKNDDRDKCEEYLIALGHVGSADEEQRHLTEFGSWLERKGYKIRIEEKNGEHVLACPYFPPVTPWIRHTFFDIKNLELLPRLEVGE